MFLYVYGDIEMTHVLEDEKPVPVRIPKCLAQTLLLELLGQCPLRSLGLWELAMEQEAYVALELDQALG